MSKHKNNSQKFYDKFLQNVEKFIPENYYRKHLSGSNKFDLFENPQFQEFLQNAPGIVGVFNNVDMGYEFISDNFESITGHSPEIVKGPNGMERVLSTFLVEHAVIYNSQIFPTIYEYFQTYSQNQEIKKFRFTASFQLVKKDKSIIWCMQQLSVIETDEAGFPLLILLFMSDITHIKKDTAIDFVIAYKDNKQIFQHVYAASFLTLEQSTCFSKRELEILHLLSLGKSSYKIAEQLFISVNTVNTHRRNMLKKSNKKNTAELLSYVMNKGFVK